MFRKPKEDKYNLIVRGDRDRPKVIEVSKDEIITI